MQIRQEKDAMEGRLKVPDHFVRNKQVGQAQWAGRSSPHMHLRGTGGAPQRDNRQPRIKAANGMQPQGRRQGNEGDKRL